MAISAEFVRYVEDLFSVLPHTIVKKMFGGIGVFRHGIMYALALDDGKIALKADDITIPDFEAEGLTQCVFENKKTGKRASMGYWYAPEFIFDDPDALEEWAIKAFETAVRADAKKPPSQRKLKS